MARSHGLASNRAVREEAVEADRDAEADEHEHVHDREDREIEPGHRPAPYERDRASNRHRRDGPNEHEATDQPWNSRDLSDAKSAVP